MDLRKESDRSAFWRSFKVHRRQLDRHLDQRTELIERYCGSEYVGGFQNSKSKPPRTYINLLNLMANAYAVALAAERPRVCVTTPYPTLRPFANRFQIATNNWLEEIRFDVTLRRLVMDAFFFMGIAKVYQAPGNFQDVPNPEYPPEPGMYSSPQDFMDYAKAQESGVPESIFVDVGTPMIERISPDAFTWDMGADEWDRIKYASHQYRVPLSDVKDDDRFDPDIVKQLNADSKWDFKYGETQDMMARDISRGDESDPDEMEPMITLMDVWMPREFKWAVVAKHFENLGPLYCEEWDGPESGPYHILSYGDVPDNIVPVSPALNVRILHDLSNRLLGKVANQAKNQKTILGYSGDESDAMAVRDAQDMELVKLMDEGSVNPMRLNGVDQQTLMMYQVFDGIFSRAAGNLDARLGLGASADTATQDKLIHASVSKQEETMRIRTVDFVARVVRDGAYMLWIDQHKTIPGSLQIGNAVVDRTWTPEEREGDFIQHNFTIEPFSMKYKSPQERMQGIYNFVANFAVPLAPMLQQQGATLDFQAFVDMVADLENEPRLKEVIKFQLPSMDDQQKQSMAMPMPSGKPANTSREYIHRRAPNANGDKVQMIQALAGGGGQQQPMQSGSGMGQ